MSCYITKSSVLLSYVMLVLFTILNSHTCAQYTSFQSGQPYREDIDIKTDAVMVYTDNGERIASWANKGYQLWAMFGASWPGKDKDIVKNNPDIVQCLREGIPFEMIKGRAWVVPTQQWLEYQKDIAKKVIDAGAVAICPEEPEFFASTGYRLRNK